MNLLEVIKTPSRVDQLMGIPAGETRRVPYSQLGSFRTAISRQVKDSYPDAEFETSIVRAVEKNKPVKYGEIKRIK